MDEMFDELLEEQAGLLPEFDVEVWVDEQYVARKQSMRMAMGEEMAVTIDAEIFDVNEDIVIHLPPDYVDSVGPLSIPDPLG